MNIHVVYPYQVMFDDYADERANFYYDLFIGYGERLNDKGQFQFIYEGESEEAQNLFITKNIHNIADIFPLEDYWSYIVSEKVKNKLKFLGLKSFKKVYFKNSFSFAYDYGEDFSYPPPSVISLAEKNRVNYSGNFYELISYDVTKEQDMIYSEIDFMNRCEKSKFYKKNVVKIPVHITKDLLTKTPLYVSGRAIIMNDEAFKTLEDTIDWKYYLHSSISVNSTLEEFKDELFTDPFSPE